LHVTPYFAPAFRYGGPPRSILGLCKALQRAGVEVEVFTTNANGDTALPASPVGGDRYEGVPVWYFPWTFPRRLFGVRGLRGALESELGKCDVLHIQGLWTLPGWIAARQARRGDVPYVISPRGMLDPWSMAHRPVRKRIAYWMADRWNLRGAAFLHATSTTEATAVRNWTPGVPIVTLPNGVDVPETRVQGEFRRRLNVSADAPLLVSLGRLHVKKRLDLLAAAFERILPFHPLAQLVIAGPDEGDYRREVEPRFAAVSRWVHWTGELQDAEKWALLADATVFVMCSDSENFGLVVLEALAAGVPVVVVRTCPWGEVHTAGCGFWVPQSAEAIAEALLTLLRDPEGARAMGERGRILARTKYSWDAIARTMAIRYEAVVDARSGRVAAP